MTASWPRNVRALRRYINKHEIETAVRTDLAYSRRALRCTRLAAPIRDSPW